MRDGGEDFSLTKKEILDYFTHLTDAKLLHMKFVIFQRPAREFLGFQRMSIEGLSFYMFTVLQGQRWGMTDS